MKILLLSCVLCLMHGTFANAQTKVELEIISTTDVHGAFFHHNYLSGKDTSGGMSRVMSYLRQERAKYGNKVIFMDNGDILQGQPTAYYYNFEDQQTTHLAADMLNYMDCAVGNIGNHDIETGHSVYDRWINDCHFPVLGANIVSTSNGMPYIKPYHVINVEGVKIAILGMLTPAIPCWLPENLWSGLHFEDIEKSSRKWIPIIQKYEKPDLIIGLFHAGKGNTMLNGINENPSDAVAANVPGFDAVFFGHDHQRYCQKVYNETSRDSVLIVNGANQAYNVGVARIVIEKDAQGHITKKEITGHLESMKDYAPDADFLSTFQSQEEAIKNYVDEKIGIISKSISCEEALYGPCDFMDLIHRMQLAVSDHAQISISAPLALNAKIEKGDITIRDMFNLYKFENLLYTMNLTGAEIKGLLEMSYDMWVNKKGYTFNYDSAYGIDYTVDPTKPNGERVNITKLSDGTLFSLNTTYRVAINSYRGNGGGDLITKGAGIKKEELTNRIINSTDKDLRFYLIEYIRKNQKVTPSCSGNWHFIPKNWGRQNLTINDFH